MVLVLGTGEESVKKGKKARMPAAIFMVLVSKWTMCKYWFYGVLDLFSLNDQRWFLDCG